jgi:cytochrome c oxidase subunit 2
MESALDPAGPQAGRLADLWWFSFWVALAVWIVVIVFLVFAVKRGRERSSALIEPSGDRPMRRGVVIASAITVVILSIFLVHDITTGRDLASLPRKNALRVEIKGHQWWWEVSYVDPTPGRMVTTANEIHIPVGEPVQIVGSSPDVIHSFWIPNLQGKKDLVPGHTTSAWLQADRPGVYRGQCAEYCGAQHAKMVALVIAERRPQFDAWYNGQLQDAKQPSDSVTTKGQEVFLKSACSVCHTIGGTLAGGTVGPSLTHLGSRLTLAAGSLRNSRGNLGGWIVDLQALLTYLESLK